MLTRNRLSFFLRRALPCLLLLAWCGGAVCSPVARAQSDGGDAGVGDPVKLFERGQDAHARNDFAAALELYDQAIELHPEFPEAEYQKAAALAALKRTGEAEKSLRRAAELRPAWVLPHATLGALLAVRPERAKEAETSLRRALELDQNNRTALLSLAALREKSAAPDALREALDLLTRATALPEANTADWTARGRIETLTGGLNAAQTSFDRALRLDRQNVEAYLGRAALDEKRGDLPAAANILEEARRIVPASPRLAFGVAKIYAQVGALEKARAVLSEAHVKDLPEAAALRNALADDDQITPEGIEALVKESAANPKNAALFARLGNIYRTKDPARSLDYYRRALELEPRQLNYAVGYGSALVQAKRFPVAVEVLRRVLSVDANHYVAHANLATALYELKDYSAAITEYQWIAAAKPELAATHFFIATAYDNLNLFADALASYQTFLSKADAPTNSLEIEKVKLRLPSLLNQIKRGEGVKRKPQDR
jgi:tetratricopeptide (TPR) repeat protein